MRHSKLKLNDILVQRKGSAISLSAERVRESIRTLLHKSDVVTINMCGVKSLSPSFAYNAFGHLYDTFKDQTKNLLKFENDEYNLSDRIYKAIDRRKFVVEDKEPKIKS